MSRDKDVIGLGFGHASSDDADAHFRYKLDGDTGSRARTLEIIDQLLQIFDRINIVMGRRGDKTNTLSYRYVR